MMAERFLVLRGTHAGPVFLARPDQADDADTWTEDREDARRFDDRGGAETARAEIVGRCSFVVAVVPDYIRHAMTARATRVGPGPDRPAVHSYADAQQAHRRAVADLAALRASEG